MRRAAAIGWLSLPLLLVLAAPAAGQERVRTDLRESQQRLEQIRRERERLQREMDELRSRVSDVSGEITNIERQITASADVLRELDFQSAALATDVAETSRRLLLTRDRLVERRVVLQQRLRAIYKRGPLHALRVLLSAESFADLLNRYKYLHLITLYDRVLLEDITELERQLASQERSRSRNLAQLRRLRAEKLEEFAQLQSLESEQERALQSYRQRERQAETRLQQLARDEARLTNLVADLERRRKEAERRRAVAGAAEPEASITTRDIGKLDWPVEGELVYGFGPQRKPNGVVLRWNGIGIAARPGTEVQAVEAGTVVMAGPFEGYGPSVMVSHGGGYYTLYLYLRDLLVRDGDRIRAGQTIGTVGGERTPEGAHIEFQVRAPIRGGVPEPVDPLDWLQRRRAAR